MPAAWLADDELIAEARNHPTWKSLAQAIGRAESSLHNYADRRELRDDIEAALAGPAQTPDVDSKALKLTSAREELKYLRHKVREYQSREASGHDLIERILASTREPVETASYTVAEQDPELPRRSAIVPVLDQQYGQKVRRTDTPGGVGYFNREVFDHRLARWYDAVTRSIRDYAQSHFLEDLVINLGGDHVEGADIFRGQAWQLEIDPATQVMELTVKMEAALRNLIRFCREEIGVRRVRIYGVPGNHGKVGGKQAGATPTSFSFDVLFLEWLKDKLRGEPIDHFVIEPAGSILFEAAQHTFLSIHGDEIKGHMGIPFYGQTRFDGRMVRMMDAIFDYVILGHHHQQGSIPNGGGEYIWSGDWVGANNLSREMPRAGRPKQWLLFAGANFGVTEYVPIYLTRRDEETAPTIHR